MFSQKHLPERIVSGSFHLIWLTLLALLIIGAKPEVITSYIKDLSGGAAALIASIIVGVSFFLGDLSDQIISDVVRLIASIRKISPKPILNLCHLRIGHPEEILDLENRYMNKAFYRSIAIAGIFVIVLSLMWCSSLDSASNVRLSILAIGFIVDFSCWRIYFKLRKQYSELYDKLEKNP